MRRRARWGRQHKRPRPSESVRRSNPLNRIDLEVPESELVVDGEQRTLSDEGVRHVVDVRSRIGTTVRLLLVLTSASASGCEDSASGPLRDPVVRIQAALLSDTIDAILPQGLVVEVSGTNGLRETGVDVLVTPR